MTIKVPQELQKKLSEEAKKRGQTRNGLVLQILWGFFEKGEKFRERSSHQDLKRCLKS